MNMMTTIIARPLPPIALLRALPPGPLAKEHQRLQRLAELFAAFDRDDMEAGVDLLLAEMDARDGDADTEDDDRAAATVIVGGDGQYFDEEPFAFPDGLAGDPADAEEDDDAGGDIVDEPHDKEEDFGAEEAGEPILGCPEQYAGKWGDGAAGSMWPEDDDAEPDNPAARASYLKAARARRVRA